MQMGSRATKMLQHFLVYDWIQSREVMQKTAQVK